MSIEAMKQALEALEWNYGTDLENIENCTVWLDKLNATIPALRQAIEQAEKQEPVAFRNTETGEFCTGGFLRKDWAKWQPLYTAPPHDFDDVTDDALIEEVRRRGFTIRDVQIEVNSKSWNEIQCQCGHKMYVKHTGREWVSLDHEEMRNTPIQFKRGALWAERWLKEKNN